MAADKEGFILYKNTIHTVKHLPIEKIGELFLHILKYVNDENPQSSDPLITIAFEPIKQSLKKDLEKYKTKVEKNRENALKRWHQLSAENANASEPMRTNANNADIGMGIDIGIGKDIGIDILLKKETKDISIQEINFKTDTQEIDEVEDEKKVATKKRFRAPSVQEVQDYCNERKNNISAYKFVNFYQAKDWKIGKNKMVDWEAAVRTWEQSNENNDDKRTSSGNRSNANKVSKQATFNIQDTVAKLTSDSADGNIPGQYT